MFDFIKSLGKAFTDGMGLNAQPNSANTASSANGVNNAPPQVNEPAAQIVPDKPVPFGYKTSWLCVKANSPGEVIEKVGLKNPRACNWNDGVYGGKGVLVSPVLDGYVLVVNWGMDVLDTAPENLDELAKKFSELQFFSTHRVAEYHAWVKYAGGEMIRGYGWCGDIGEMLLNKGAVTPEETELGLTNLLPDSKADWGNYDFPDEQNVLDIAAAWGIDTGFTRKTYPASTGFLCNIK